VSGEHCKLSSGVWGGAAAEIESGTFYLLNVTSGGNSFNDFLETVPTAEKSQPAQRNPLSFSRACAYYLSGPNAAACAFIRCR